MPAPSRWMIRLALCFLLLGVTLGAIVLIHKAVDIHPLVWTLLPVHVEVLLWGFVIQFTMGTAYWILPRYLTGNPRGSRWVPWLMAFCLNAGILLLCTSNFAGSNSRVVHLAGLFLKLLSVIIFVGLQWNRITSYRNFP